MSGREGPQMPRHSQMWGLRSSSPSIAKQPSSVSGGQVVVWGNHEAPFCLQRPPQPPIPRFHFPSAHLTKPGPGKGHFSPCQQLISILSCLTTFDSITLRTAIESIQPNSVKGLLFIIYDPFTWSSLYPKDGQIPPVLP